MSTSVTTDGPASGKVVVAVLAEAGGDLAASLDAVAAQSYSVERLVVIGGAEAERIAAERGLDHYPVVGDLVEALGGAITHVWLLHGDSRPRTDALSSLVEEAERNDASMAGSKILAATSPDLLQSIGSATDIFGEPYSGLDVGEVDLQQYDVVRDVALLSGVSLLVRRDLLRGLGGPDPLLPPQAAGLDLSQRARLAGGRVVVVPSSEVLHEEACEHRVPGWREQAGRLRAMLKAYRPITLAWVVPLALLTGLVEGLARLLMRRPAVVSGLVAAWGWNLWHLPSTVRARRALRSIRHQGDEELFRYQIGGSVALRRLGDELTGHLAHLLDEDTSTERRRWWRSPTFIAALLAAVVALVASRSIWFDQLPVFGYSLPLTGSPVHMLVGYAGGWNTAGLGSPEPMHPAVAASAVAQLIALGRGPLAMTALTLAALLLGVVGTARLLATVGLVSPWRYAAGLVTALGPAAAGLAADGRWPGLVAAGALPWAVTAALRPRPQGARRLVGMMAGACLWVVGAALFAPVTLVIPLVMVVAWLAVGYERRWFALVVTALGGLAALPMLMPWSLGVSLGEVLFSGRPVTWQPPWWVLASVGGAALLTVGFGDRRSAAVGLWGSICATAGLLLSRIPDLGREPTVAGLVLACSGLGLLAGAGLELWHRAMPLRFAWAGGAALLATVAMVVPGGRAGFPAISLVDQLAFTASLAPTHGADRVLLVGTPSQLPGDSRQVDGFAYRVAAAPLPTLGEAFLPDPRLGDEALDEVVSEVASGTVLRPGKLLAPFAIRWVIAFPDSRFEGAIATQADLAPLPISSEFAAYENLSARPRAERDDGTAWSWERPWYAGPAGGGTVRLAENADSGWGGDWQQDGWANRVSASTGRAIFTAQPIYRAGAVGAAACLLVIALGAWWGRRR